MRTYFNYLGALLLLAGAALPAQALNLFACEPEWAALAREIAPQATIYTATTAQQDPHLVQARPSLIAAMRRADMAICSGAELEIGWMPALLMKANNAGVRNPDLGLFYVAEHVAVLDKLSSVDRSMGDVHAMGNPHVHLSPLAIADASAQLADRLAQLDPANASAYRANQADFAERWRLAVDDWQQRAAPLRDQQLVAYHTTYRYLFDWLGIRQVGDLEPKPGLPPSTGHLRTLLSEVSAPPVIGVVYTGYQDPKPGSWLAQQLGVPALKLEHTTSDTESLFELYEQAVTRLLHLVHHE